MQTGAPETSGRGRDAGLLVKLLGIHVLIIACVISIVWLAIDTLAVHYFMILMDRYNVPTASTQQMFLASVHRYLIWASVAALVVSILLGFTLLRRLLSPLSDMIRTTRRISSGDFSARVPVRSHDEVGQLAWSFNRMAESLERTEGLRKKLMIDVAHELRTPLTNIRGYMEALVDGVAPPSQETFEIVQAETLRLGGLVEDVLDLARADAAAGSLNLQPIRLGRLVEDEISRFRSRFESKGIGVSLKTGASEGSVLGDADKLGQVLRNLTQNALQYTPEGGEVRVSLEQVGDDERVVFSNPAFDLDPTDVPFLFQRFYRGEKSRSRDRGGAGIGLAIVKELVEAHGGRVGADLIEDRLRVWFSLPVGRGEAGP